MMQFLKILFHFSLIVRLSYSLTEKVSYELKEGWKFKSTGNQTWLPAKVPGVVHLDLLNNQIIPDPFWRDTEGEVQWIEELDWEYTTKFTLPEDLLKKKFIRFVFHGLDTHAYVSLNDKLIHESHSQFNRYYVDFFNPASLQGEQNLHVLFKSAPKHDLEKHKKMFLPADNPHIWSRKAGYHYGWDWGPRLCVSGIWKPIIVEGFDSAVIEYAYAYAKQISNAEITIGLEVEFAAVAPGNYFFEVSLKNISGVTTRSSRFKVKSPGNYTLETEMSSSALKLWYPNGFRGQQPLYDFDFVLLRDDKIIDEKSIRTGFRTTELVQEPDSKGSTFFLRINSKDIFMKGANYIPPESLMPRMTKEKYWKYAEIAKESNYNMLRIWGGGQYEDNEFYNALDAHGITIWHDFMFAGGIYPADAEYTEMMKIEFEQQIKRLRNHPSIVIYCGNNEIHEGIGFWGWGQGIKEGEGRKWYETIFHSLIPEALKNFDKVRVPYWPSSPLRQWDEDESMLIGDSHYWGIWHGDKPFEITNTKVPRFMAEYGMQGVPNIETIKMFTKPEDRNISSKVMKVHQKHRIGWIVIQKYLDYYHQDPKDFEGYVYVTQLLQAKAFQTAIEAERRNMPYCMGTLYWQFNDCWPVTSWATLDYYFTWKAAQYRVKKYYSEVIVSTYQNPEDELEVYVVSDSDKQQLGTIELSLFGLDGKLRWRTKLATIIGNSQSILVYKQAVNKILKETDLEAEVVFHVLLQYHDRADPQQATQKFEHFHYFVKPKELKLQKPDFMISLDKAAKEVIVKAENIIKDLELYVEGSVLELEDNYFDLVPGEQRIKVKASWYEKLEKIEANEVKARSLWDTYNGDRGNPYRDAL